MTDTKTIVKVWNYREYGNAKDAALDGALLTYDVPEFDTMAEQVAWFQGFDLALRVAGMKLVDDKDALKYDDVLLTAYTVRQQIVEVNEYTGTVYAEDESDLAERMKDSDLIAKGDYEITQWGTGASTENDGEWWVV